MAKVRFPKSNSLDFRRTEYYDEFPLDSDEVRLYYDRTYTSIDNTCYFPKLGGGQDVWFQFRTDYQNFTITLFDEVGNETIYIPNADPVTLTENRTQYEVDLNASTLEGNYYVVISFEDAGKPIANFQSEWFQIQAEYDDCLLNEWKQDDYPTNYDGMIWGDKNQSIWLKSRLSDYVAGTLKSVYETANYKFISTQAQPIKSKVLQIEPIPDIIAEKLNIALQKGYFYVNKERYNTEETFEAERLGDTRDYPIQLTLRLVEDALGYAYEDYTEDFELSGEIPPIEEVSLAFSDTEDMAINNTDDLLIQGI